MTKRSAKVRVMPEGERAFTAPLSVFLRDNRDGISARQRAAIKGGKKVCGGGGASPAWCVVKVKTKRRGFGDSEMQDVRSRMTRIATKVNCAACARQCGGKR